MSTLFLISLILGVAPVLFWISGPREDVNRANRLRQLREEREKAARRLARRGATPRASGRAS